MVIIYKNLLTSSILEDIEYIYYIYEINNKDQYCAIFNISEVKQEVSLAQVLKDSTMATSLWTSERVDGTTNITIPSHGAVLIKHS